MHELHEVHEVLHMKPFSVCMYTVLHVMKMSRLV